MVRKVKKKIRCGNVDIGGGAPVSIQSMLKVGTEDIATAATQIDELREAGCDIVRIATPDLEAARAFRILKNKLGDKTPPLVADVHFDYRLAIAAIENGADKIRINPGNIGNLDNLKAVVKAAKAGGIPIRVGINSGSLEKDILIKHGGVTAEGLVESALRNVAMIEKMDFEDIVISIKSSDVRINYEAHRLLDEKTSCPLHVGVTEAGIGVSGTIKSAAGIGALLLCGIGDTIRVSLTGDPVREVLCAKEILEAVGLRDSGINIISCPTCGRTKADVERIAAELLQRLAPLKNRRLSVAVMGCAVNGPGEAKEADLGVACGDGKGVLFVKGKIVTTVPEDEIVDEIVKIIENSSWPSAL